MLSYSASSPIPVKAPKEGSMFIKDVDKLDCAVFVPSRGIIGHSWYVDIEVKGQLGDEGFVYDFSKLKSLVKNLLKETTDHALLLPILSDKVEFSKCDVGEHWKLAMRGSSDVWEYICPTGAVYPIKSKGITKDQIELELSRLIKHRLPEHISQVKTKLREEKFDATEAFFHYTHGIREHDGLCQRVFHGHKSKLEVHVGNERRVDLEHYIVRKLFSGSIHIASQCQIATDESNTILKTDENSQVLFYESSLGYYEARVPKNQLFITEEKTSIEAISKKLAAILKKKMEADEEKVTSKVKVIAFEGIDKGAIATI